MSKILVEENNLYELDCTAALWATDQIHEEYHRAKTNLKDADFLIETEEQMLLVEYKNSNVPNAANPGAFDPEKKANDVVQKFYDSLHYLYLLGKSKPVCYIWVLESEKSDLTIRKRLRNRLYKALPFLLQEYIGDGKKLIEGVDVVSIAEWNADQRYGRYPLRKRN